MTEVSGNTVVYMTVDEVAARYKVSVDTIWRWKRNGSFPKAVRISSGATRWRLTDLLAFDETLQACFATDASFLIQTVVHSADHGDV